MRNVSKEIRLNARIEQTQGEGRWHILRIPRDLVAPLGLKGSSRRVTCTLNGSKPIQCALFPIKGGEFFITVNSKLREKLKLENGDDVAIVLTKDDSKYGLPMPRELQEAMRQDEDGSKLFHELSPGNQRLSIRLVDMAQDIDKRIRRSLILLEYLKYRQGKFVYNEISNALKAKPPIGETD
jgi:bifunctional DNA-binding transcriptional regulator/antitoxin component of YhaV-PrlF toxin-antitoxin module